MKKEIFAVSAVELKEYVSSLGLPAFRAGQIYGWLYQKHIWDFAAMSNLAQKDIALLGEHFKILPAYLRVLRELASQDGLTDKLLLQLEDGNTVETVGMRHDYGNSVCVSSQSGCAMGCAFCASTVNGLARNLTSAEMLSQVAYWQKVLQKTGGRVDSVVIMGSGEPLLNYDEVLRFIRLLHDKDVYNISYRSITLSTCGIVPGMEKLAQEQIPISLAVSLHAPDDELRSRLMPINEKFKIKDVLAAAKNYASQTGRQITYEYLLIKGVNDSELCADKLADLLHGTLCAVNLIPCNAIAEKGWVKPDKKQVERFIAVLKKRKIPVTIRKEMGADIGAACGQLRAAAADKTSSDNEV